MASTEVGKQKLLEVLYEAMAEVNLELLDEDQLALDPSTALFGEAAALDSMAAAPVVVASGRERDLDRREMTPLCGGVGNLPE